MSIIFASEPRSQSTMSAPESSRRPSALSSKDVVPPSAGSAPPLQSVVQLRTLPAAADLQLQGLEVRAYGIWLWLEQVGAITFKNFRVRIFSWEVVAKWFVAVVLLVSITLVESTNSELRTDVLALSLLLSFVAILLIPYGVFEINSGYLQIFKLHRCTFTTMAASELLFLFVVLFIIFIIAMSIFMAVTIGTGVHDEELLYLCNLDNVSACRCVVVSNETDGVWVERELAILEEITTLVTDGTHDGVFWWYGRIVNEPGSWFMLLAVSVSLALGLSGLSLIISSLFRHHRMAAFFGGILLIFARVLANVLK
ncbi:Hypothetical Protein FCC1311_060591 [Hondaea fermentalgiana]|uniref:Transmembrane protein n=1 Tax=Hondaea fermentalgiana TaxID=2315210 RepID=A0A2R5GEP0_9STRA|nr:Hypothetical Protein FCC1311_060591 [Hondaea fermentalgiana]|eukprot:GBG29392.1 Hypothetical Protein FCC1311_060591 [Hondaea fermentalgiana]